MRVKFIAYAGDCQVAGATTLPDGERLTDHLNRDAMILVDRAQLTSLADGHTFDAGDIELKRDDLFAIEALGQRGEAARRIHTVRHRLEVRMGPYTILGQLHTAPGGQPLAAISRRAVMIPLTGATIAFNTSTGVEALDVQTLIINRALAEWVRADAGDLPVFPSVPILPALASAVLDPAT